MNPLWLLPFLFSLVTSTQLSSLLTVPYFAGLHKDNFDSELWGVWFRIFTFVLTTVASIGGALAMLFAGPILRRGVALGLGVALAAVMYNVLFGLRIAQIVGCETDACMEANSACQYAGSVRGWEGTLFSFSLCVLLCALSLSLALLLSLDQPSAAHPDSMDQDISVTHDNSPLKSSKQNTEKAGLMEPVFVPSNRNAQTSNPLRDKSLGESAEFRGATSLRNPR
jgi:hypothetical protein